MISLPALNFFSVFLIEILGVLISFLVYLNNPKNKLNLFFTLMTFSILVWIFLGYMSHTEQQVFMSLMWYKLNLGTVCIFFIFSYFFSIYFPVEGKRNKKLDFLIVSVDLFIFYLMVFTDLIIAEAKLQPWGVDFVLGRYSMLFYGMVYGVTMLVFYNFYKKYFTLSLRDKLKTQYFLIGISLFAIFNIIFNVSYPIFFRTFKYYWIGDYSAMFLLTFTAYAIVKRELMGIKTLLTQVILVVISVILLTDVFFLSDNQTMQLLKLGVLGTFLYFSREMVASAKKEKESREALEKINIHLEEKTQDMEALLSLNEMASSTTEIENSVQNIMDAVPEKLGHLGIMGTFLIRYSQDTKKAYAYIITQSEQMRRVRKLLSKPKLSDYSVIVDAEKPKKQGLIIKSILENKIEKGTDLANFISPPLDRRTARLMQKGLGAKTFVSVPMMIRGKKKGALVFIFTKDISEITARDLGLIRAFTQHVGVVRDNLHFYHHLNKNIEELTHTKDKLKEMLQMKNDFLHIVSHQLRTPLTAMRGFISMWSDGDFDALPADKMLEIKNRIVNNSERLNNIVNDMVMAMESEGELKVEFKPMDLRQILQGNIEMLKPNYEKKNLYLKYEETTKDIPKIEADEKLLLNVFMNLIDNAEKYTDKGGLTIAVGQEGDNAKIEFVDTGIGLSKEDKKILFKKFSRGAKSNYINPNGSGLGLFIIKQIITKHHGKIKANSKGEGQGATFTITLPIKQGK